MVNIIEMPQWRQRNTVSVFSVESWGGEQAWKMDAFGNSVVSVFSVESWGGELVYARNKSSMVELFQYSLWNLGVVNHHNGDGYCLVCYQFQYSLWNLGVVNRVPRFSMADHRRFSILCGILGW